MGFDVATVDDLSGAIFTGAGTSMSMVWFWLAVIVCVVALWSGHRHEHAAYKRLKK